MKKIDKNSMESMVRAFPELLGSIELSKEIQNLCSILGNEGPSGVCIVGMGGSAIAGSYVQGLLYDVSYLPIVTVRDSVLPEFIDENWITLFVSYSGNTEETLTAFKESVKRGCPTITISSGGLLGDIKESRGTVIIPEGFQPRAAFPMLFSIVLQVVESLLGLEKTDLKSIAEILSAKLDAWESSSLSPKSMANDLLVMTPVFIGSRHLNPVAYRAKCQFNENAKVMAFNSEIPESNHNEIESFNENNDQTILPLLLSSAFQNDRISKRFEIVSDIYEDDGFIPIRLSMKSDSKIEEMLMMTFYLDMVSIELAVLIGVDSLRVDKISRLKKELGDLEDSG
ncbi:MAG: bifunctional phosphoglucose/phosphomannose isomerase [Candidatus Thorarchaeota archaeon]